MPYWGTFDFFIFLFLGQKVCIVGAVNESKMFKKFVLALRKDLKSFFSPQSILGTSIEPYKIESKNLKKCP